MAMDAATRKEYSLLLKGVPKFKDDKEGSTWPEWRIAFENWLIWSGMSDFPVPGGNERVIPCERNRPLRGPIRIWFFWPKTS